jgi:hypothetical protein
MTQLSREKSKIMFGKIQILTQLFFSRQKKLNSNPENVDLNLTEIEPELEEDIFIKHH